MDKLEYQRNYYQQHRKKILGEKKIRDQKEKKNKTRFSEDEEFSIVVKDKACLQLLFAGTKKCRQVLAWLKAHGGTEV